MSQELSLTQIPQAVPWALTPDSLQLGPEATVKATEKSAFLGNFRRSHELKS